ncbi:MAG TPA: type II toxin-antitoxin system RatA family toxin [Alphaproteobacteria bacterium]|nr:type II toxin-antitoxin system RatA family toxin [Alphaproteobacteria bacterium]
MPTHAEKRILPYRADQLFDLVADIERYPEFLPWCRAARIRRREADTIYADLIIGWRMIRESFTSRVVLQRPARIDVSYHEGPFKYLNNHWIFEQQPDGNCLIDFYVDFEFRSKMLQKVIGVLFNEAVRRMVHAFEERARKLYGRAPPAGASQPSPHRG